LKDLIFFEFWAARKFKTEGDMFVLYWRFLWGVLFMIPSWILMTINFCYINITGNIPQDRKTNAFYFVIVMGFVSFLMTLYLKRHKFAEMLKEEFDSLSNEYISKHKLLWIILFVFIIFSPILCILFMVIFQNSH